MKMIHEKLPDLMPGSFLLPAGSGAGSCSGIVENPRFSQERQPSAHSTTPYTTLASVP